MSRNDKKKFSAGSLLENNKIVFIISLLISVVFWAVVSIYETPETERVLQNVKVQLTGTEELAEQYGLSVFDTEEYTVDVTVKGPSYLVNASSFTADSINVTASCIAVATPGTYPITLDSALTNPSGEIKITKLSKNSINVYFDKEVSKKFTLTEDIQELEGYSLAEGMIRENPVLNTETVTISGPSRDINKITSVKAHVELNKELKKTERFDAEIIPESESGTLDTSNLTVKTDGPFYITIPINHTGTYNTVVSFSHVPKAYRTEGLKYTVTPATVDVKVATGDGALEIESDNINVGTIDFNDIIGEKVNYFTLENKEINGETTQFRVAVDASAYYVRWTTVPVETKSVKIPEGVSIVSEEINSVRLVGPKSSLVGIDKTAAYAIPVLDNVSKLSAGRHTVPAKIKIRTLTDSWVYGSYSIEIDVK